MGSRSYRFDGWSDRRGPAGKASEACERARKLEEQGWFQVRGRITADVPEENRPKESLCGLTQFEANARVRPSVVKALKGSPLKEDHVMARWDPTTRTMEITSLNNPQFWVNLRVPGD